MSYGYGGTGKVSVNNKFFDYGEPYSTGDIICCCIDLDANPRVVLFTKNGRYLDVAFRLGAESNGQTFFPHVTVKNMSLAINFGQHEPYSPPLQGFSLISRVPPHNLERGSTGPASRQECEIIMMVGLPGVGKTVWAMKYANDHPEKKYCILGTNTIMDKMKVMGLMRKRNYHGRWDALIKQATDTLNKVFKIAERKNRNYILDQTNVYFSARRRKMSNFRGYRRIAAVLVTTDEVLKERTAKREKEEGKIVPESAVLEMKANFVLPEIGEFFDDVWFTEEDKATSQRLVAEFQREGKEYKENEKKRKPSEESGSSGNQSFGDKRPRIDHPAPSMSSHGGLRGQHPDHSDHRGGFQGNYSTRGARGASNNAPFRGTPPGAHGAPVRSYNDYGQSQGQRQQGEPYGTGPQRGYNDCGPSQGYGRPGEAYGTYDSGPPMTYNDHRPHQGHERGSEPYGAYDSGAPRRYDDYGPSYRQLGSHGRNNGHSVSSSYHQPPSSGEGRYTQAAPAYGQQYGQSYDSQSASRSYPQEHDYHPGGVQRGQAPQGGRSEQYRYGGGY